MVISKFDLDVGRRKYTQGNVDIVSKFGSAPVIDTTVRDVWGGASVQPIIGMPTVPLAVRTRAGFSTADTAAGLGAQKITVVGIGESGFVEVEDIVTAGSSASANTVKKFWRVFRVFVKESGTYVGTNDGSILLENTAGLLMNEILSTQGQSETSLFSIGEDREASIIGARATVEGSKNVNLIMYQHPFFNVVDAPFSGRRILGKWDQLPEGTHDLLGPISVGLPPWTDVWFTATTNAGTSSVSTFATYIVSDTGVENILEKN